MITIALDNSKRLTTLINDLLDLERMTEGGLPIDSEPHDLLPLLQRSIDDNQSYATKYGCTLALRKSAATAMVDVDSVRLIQVMSNLLSNAAKFSPEGSTIFVDVLHGQGVVRVEVIDTGPGIPADFGDRIFDRFAQADASDTRHRGGSGLGLAISRELIHRMGGEIGYAVPEIGGSTFWFTLPTLDQVSAPLADTTEGGEDSHG